MTKEEAIQAMKKGKRITHRYFTPNEWMTSSKNGREIRFEGGEKMFSGEFWHFRQGKEWEDGYSLHSSEQNVQVSDTTEAP
jgi:hypothetical protein